MRATDQMLAKMAGEIEEKQQFMDGIVEDAEKAGRDLNDQEMELVTRTRTRLGELNEQMEPLKEARRISGESRSKIAEIAEFMRENEGERPREQTEYRSAGAYVLDRWRQQLGDREAMQRMEIFHRAAAHQTTGDNAGLLPEQVVAPVVNFVDQSRPFISALGPKQLPSWNFARPKVTQHTAVATQTAEKAELTSQKMTITKITPAIRTVGGYLNISRQDLDFTQPGILDIVINDLAAQYAILTEDQVVDNAVAGATGSAVTIPTGAATTAAVSTAIWTAVGSVYAAAKGAGRVIMVTGVDGLGLYGPLFAPVNPQNAISPGFNAADFSTGLVGQISGVPVYVTSGMAATKSLVLSTAAIEVYEDRIGALQVVEPSVLGLQVAYAGMLDEIILEPTAMVVITKTP